LTICAKASGSGAGDQLGRGRVRRQVVGDADAVDQPAFGQTTLIERRVQLQRRDRDVPAHRLTVDNRPARSADLLQEELAERIGVLDEQVRLVLARAVAGRDPRVASIEDVARDRRRRDGARPRAPLDPMREHDETPFPVRRRFDQIARAAEHAATADRGAVRGGTRARPRRVRDDERHDQREEREERTSSRRTGDPPMGHRWRPRFDRITSRVHRAARLLERRRAWLTEV